MLGHTVDLLRWALKLQWGNIVTLHRAIFKEFRYRSALLPDVS